MLRKSLTLLLLTLVMNTVHAQTVVFEGIGISIKFPKGLWKKFASMPAEKPEDPINQIYKRTDFTTDSATIQVDAAILIQELSPGTTLFDYSTDQRKNFPFKVTHIYNQKVLASKYKEITGYRGTYLDKDKSIHIVYMIHLIKGQTGLQLVIHSSKNPPEKLEKEIKKIIKSIKSTDS